MAKYNHSERTDSLIRRAYADPNYATKRGHAIANAAKELGWPRQTIYVRAIKIGAFQPRKKEPVWTEAEMELLEKNAHKHPINIRRVFKSHGYDRSAAAIVIKIKRELAGLSQARVDAGLMSSRQAGLCLGLDGRTVSRYIEKGWLKAKPLGTARTEAQGGDHWQISEKDLRDFIINHTAHLHFGKIDKFWLVDLLTGGTGAKV